jgi:hypothetical protein
MTFSALHVQVSSRSSVISMLRRHEGPHNER